MSKKNIKFHRKKFHQFLQEITPISGISIIHYRNECNQKLSFIGHSPNRTINQNENTAYPTFEMETSFAKKRSIWVIATSYEWGCHSLGLKTPHQNALYIEYENYMIINHSTEIATIIGTTCT